MHRQSHTRTSRLTNNPAFPGGCLWPDGGDLFGQMLFRDQNIGPFACRGKIGDPGYDLWQGGSAKSDVTYGKLRQEAWGEGWKPEHAS